jgi:hypothetical protein
MLVATSDKRHCFFSWNTTVPWRRTDRSTISNTKWYRLESNLCCLWVCTVWMRTSTSRTTYVGPSASESKRSVNHHYFLECWDRRKNSERVKRQPGRLSESAVVAFNWNVPSNPGTTDRIKLVNFPSRRRKVNRLDDQHQQGEKDLGQEACHCKKAMSSYRSFNSTSDKGLSECLSSKWQRNAV